MENNKKVIIGSIIAVLTLVILTVGATYAYFRFSSNNEFGSQTIEATTEKAGSDVTLTKVGEGLRLDVTATQMLEESIGNKYYASGSEESATIGKISVVGDGKYNCTYKMIITKSATSEENDLYNKFQNMANKSEGQIYLNVNEEVYDFNTSNLFPITYTETLRNITGEEYIKANLTIVNSEVDQTELNGGDIKIQFEIEEFNCEVVEDTSAPETFNLSLGGIDNPEYTNTEEIEVYLEWEESDVESYCLTEENTSTNCSWVEIIQTRALTYNTTTSYTLSSGDGEKTVYLYLKDTANNISKYASDTIILDKIAPTSNSVKINNDAAYTNSTGVTLTISSSDATEMCISNTESCTSYETYATSKSWTLTTEDGTKTVYVWFRDEAGNTTSTYVSDTITLDTSIPTVSASVSNNNTSSPTMSITTSEAGTYCVNTDGTASTMTGCVFTGSINANTAITTSTFTTDGTYYAHVQDTAGNVGISSGVSVTVGEPAGSTIIDKAPSGLNTTARNGMYRFVGSTANNYVSIGGVSYRIIGITSTANSTLGLEAGQLKVIKAASIGTYNWHTSATTNTIWTSSAMYTYLNNTVLNNTSYIPSGWSSKISSVKWNIGDVTSYTNASTIIGLEDDTVTSSTRKIGLMYLSDYYYAYTAGGGTNCNSVACTSWMTDTSNATWTMTRCGYNFTGDGYIAFHVYSGGKVSTNFLSTTNAVRPVFYLKPDVKFVSGNGSSGSPFIVE